MLDLLGMIAALNRPRLLVSAARFGVEEYSRGTELPRLLRCGNVPRSGEAIIRLLDLEAGLETLRVSASTEYTPGRHVAVLAALLGEARLLRATHRAALAAEAIGPIAPLTALRAAPLAVAAAAAH